MRSRWNGRKKKGHQRENHRWEAATGVKRYAHTIFPRTGFSLHKLEQVLEGDIDEIIDNLITHYQAESLKELTYAE
jgi:hypothetical protein